MQVMASPRATALHDAELSGEERALAAFLRTDVLDAFDRTRGSEQRVDVYLALQRVLRLEDTPGSVRELQRHLPRLLRVVREDLQDATMEDLLHVALRTLSYFMHHPSLARCFRDDQVESFLTVIMSRLGSTHEETTYKVCLWCLTMQDFDLARLDFLPRIVEALVLAIINPFKSRLIAVQALKGLQLMLFKFKSLMLRAPTLRIWFKPVACRLGSSDKKTRDLAALVLLEAASGYDDPQRKQPASEETDKEIVEALMQYALPAIQTHVTHERLIDALAVWKIVMLMMKRVLVSDLPLLNSLIAVPEAAMRHGDASVRLHSVEAWRYLILVFRQNDDWLFKRPVIVMLMRPLLSCLEDEGMLNILHAALATWRLLLTAVVEDFNKYTKTQGESADVMQQSAKLWRRWMDEVVRKMVSTAIERVQRPSEPGTLEVSLEAVFDTVETTVRDLFAPLIVGAAVPARVALKQPQNTNQGSESSLTTAASSATESQVNERRRPRMDLSEQDDQVLDDELLEHSLSAIQSTQGSQSTPPISCPALSGHIVGLALSISDILGLVQKLSQAATNPLTTSDPLDIRRRGEGLAFHVWEGLCTRLKLASTDERQDEAMNRLRVRVVRMALDFSFGSSTSGATLSSMDSQASVLMPSLQTDSVMTAADLIQSSSLRIQGTQGGLPFLWQLRLLRDIIDTTTSVDELTGLLQHPKSKKSHLLLTRIDGIVEHDAVFRVWLAQWDRASKEGDQEDRIDFSAKKSIALCVLLYVVMNLAVLFDDTGATAATGILGEATKFAEDIMTAVSACAASSSRCVTNFLRIVRSTPQAASQLLMPDNDVDVSGPGKLLKLCTRLAHRREDTQDNAETLLQLQRSPVRELSSGRAAVLVSTPVRSANSTASTVAPSPTQPGTSAVSDGSSLPSPCLLQPTKANKPAVRITSQEVPVQASSLSPTRRSTAVVIPTTPQTPSKAAKCPGRAVTTPSRQPMSTPVASSLTAEAPTPQAPAQGSVFPELVSCTDLFSNLQNHFPAAFRTLAPLHKINTVGDLSAMSLAQIKKLGIKDPVATVMKALRDYHVRKTRPKPTSSAVNSPFRPRPGASVTRLPSPSPKRQEKRPMASPAGRRPVTPLPLEESPQRKRARRTLRELSSELDQAETKQDRSSGQQTLDSVVEEQRKVANRVTFRLDTGDGETKITRPGEESQEATPSRNDEDDEKESASERVQTYAYKMIHHLSRALHYGEKIGAEENSKQSEASLRIGQENLGVMMKQFSSIESLVMRINAQLVRASDEIVRAEEAGLRNANKLWPSQ